MSDSKKNKQPPANSISSSSGGIVHASCPDSKTWDYDELRQYLKRCGDKVVAC